MQIHIYPHLFLFLYILMAYKYKYISSLAFQSKINYVNSLLNTKKSTINISLFQ